MTKTKARNYLPSDIKRLFAFSGNQCSKPDCRRPVISEDDGISIIGYICHIEAASSKGPRYNKEMTDNERISYNNLILLCDEHHKTIDNIKNEGKYTKELLLEWKNNHISINKGAEIVINDKTVLSVTNEISDVIEHIEEHVDKIHNKVTSINEDLKQIKEVSLHIGNIINKNDTYNQILEKIEMYEIVLKNSKDEAKRFEYSHKLNLAIRNKEEFELQVKSLYNEFHKFKFDNERLNLALKEFDKGNFEAANSVLDEVNMNAELLELKERKIKRKEEKAKDLIQRTDLAKSFIIKAKLMTLEFDNEKRLKISKDLFKKALKVHKNFENLHEFGFWLEFHNFGKESLKLYKKAIIYVRKLINENHFKKIYSLVKCFIEYSAILLECGDKKSSEYILDEGIGYLDQFKIEIENETLLKSISGDYLMTRARLREINRKYKLAIDDYKKTIVIWTTLVENSLLDDEDKILYQGNLAATLSNIGRVYGQIDNYEKASLNLHRGLKIMHKLAKELKGYSSYIYAQLNNVNISRTLGFIGLLYYRSYMDQKALKTYKKAMEFNKKQSEMNPEVFLIELAKVYMELGNLEYFRNSNNVQALVYLRKALKIKKKFLQFSPSTYLRRSVEQIEGRILNIDPAS